MNPPRIFPCNYCQHIDDVVVDHRRSDGALEIYAAAMQRFPISHMLRCNRGGVMLDRERYDEALEHFSESLRIEPDYIFALANMASTMKA